MHESQPPVVCRRQVAVDVLEQLDIANERDRFVPHVQWPLAHFGMSSTAS
jgi:hypothetical protein